MRPLIDPEFQSLLTPLTPEEHDGLCASIEREGCREPLVVWAETGILIDGHNRFGICTDLGVTYTQTGVPLPNRKAALLWIIANQFGRRNLTPVQRKYLLGKRYELEKGDPVDTLKRGDKLPRGQNGDTGRTSERIARDAHVSPKTIERAEALAKAIDATATRVGPEFREAALSHTIRLTDADFADLAGRDDVTTMEQVETYAEERATARRPRPSTSPEVPFVTVTVTSWTTTTDPETGEELVDVWLLGCGHEVPCKRRTPARETHQKTMACPECGSGTRTGFERRKAGEAFEERFGAVWASDAHRHHWFALVRGATLLATLGPMDARQSGVRARVTEALSALGLLEVA